MNEHRNQSTAHLRTHLPVDTRSNLARLYPTPTHEPGLSGLSARCNDGPELRVSPQSVRACSSYHSKLAAPFPPKRRCTLASPTRTQLNISDYGIRQFRIAFARLDLGPDVEVELTQYFGSPFSLRYMFLDGDG